MITWLMRVLGMGETRTFIELGNGQLMHLSTGVVITPAGTKEPVSIASVPVHEFTGERR